MVSASADLGDGRMAIIDYTRIHVNPVVTVSHPNSEDGSRR